MRHPATWSELRLKVIEIIRLSRQLAIRESSNTPIPGAGSTNRRDVENDDSSDRLIPHLNVIDKGASITRDEVSKQVCGSLTMAMVRPCMVG